MAAIPPFHSKKAGKRARLSEIAALIEDSDSTRCDD